MSIDMVLLDAVVAVAKAGGFREAARITGSNASRQIFSDLWLYYNVRRLIPAPLQAFIDFVHEINARDKPVSYTS
jgi:DNA-binding transcriptional LysR family regulator